MGEASSLNLSEFTIEAWVRRTGPGETTASGQSSLNPVWPVVTKGRTGQDGGEDDVALFLGVMDDGTVGGDFEDAGGTDHFVIGSTDIGTNEWHHIATTYDGAQLKVYVDGVEDGSQDVSESPTPNSTAHFAVGTTLNPQGNPAGFFEGQIDEVRVWDFARSESDIASDFGSSITSGAGLVASYPFEENSGGTDDATGSVDGTASGDAGYFTPGATCQP
jgi:hypothetical protein